MGLGVEDLGLSGLDFVGLRVQGLEFGARCKGFVVWGIEVAVNAGLLLLWNLSCGSLSAGADFESVDEYPGL